MKIIFSLSCSPVIIVNVLHTCLLCCMLLGIDLTALRYSINYFNLNDITFLFNIHLKNTSH